MIADNLVDVSLAEETRKSADFMDMVFEEAAKTLTIEGDAHARVNRSLDMRAITNLLDNAVRHGSGDGAVTIADHGGAVSVAVANQAPPIAPEHLARIFDRFYRIDPARQSSGESYGLGLAAVKAVALMHDGTVFAQSIGNNVLVGFALARGDAGRGAGRAQRRRAVPELSAD